MGRNKRDTEFLDKACDRYSTFRKRRGGLRKKVKELSTLCGIKAVMICRGQKKSQEENPRFKCWAYDSSKLTRDAGEFIHLLNSLSREERSKAIYEQEKMLNEQIKDVKKQLVKQKRITAEVEKRLQSRPRYSIDDLRHLRNQVEA
ncbi:hypothetical protein KI387_036094, partial [Taxus chinensis]